jgi:DNA-binding NarL/FixJ family response regulator
VIDYAAILTRRYAGSEWAIDGNDYAQLQWFSDSPKPTKAELDSAWSGVQAEIAAEHDAKVSARNSALAKLFALGLTEAEIAALVA